MTKGKNGEEETGKTTVLLLSKRKRNLRFICFPARSTAQKKKKKKTAPQNYLLPIFKQELEVFVFVFTVPWRGRYTNSSPPLTTSRRRRSKIMRRCPLTLPDKNQEHISYVVSFEKMLVICEPSSVTHGPQCVHIFEF